MHVDRLINTFDRKYLKGFRSHLKVLIVPTWAKPLYFHHISPSTHRLAVQSGMDTFVVLLSGIANIVAGVMLRRMGWVDYVWLVLSGCAMMTALAFWHHIAVARSWKHPSVKG